MIEIDQVVAGSPAFQEGLRPGMRILGVGEQPVPVKTLAEFEVAVAKARSERRSAPGRSVGRWSTARRSPVESAIPNAALKDADRAARLAAPRQARAISTQPERRTARAQRLVGPNSRTQSRIIMHALAS